MTARAAAKPLPQTYDVQLLFDTNGSVNDTWRQARVPLDDFAGQQNLLRDRDFIAATLSISF